MPPLDKSVTVFDLYTVYQLFTWCGTLNHRILVLSSMKWKFVIIIHMAGGHGYC